MIGSGNSIGRVLGEGKFLLWTNDWWQVCIILVLQQEMYSVILMSFAVKIIWYGYKEKGCIMYYEHFWNGVVITRTPEVFSKINLVCFISPWRGDKWKRKRRFHQEGKLETDIPKRGKVDSVNCCWLSTGQDKSQEWGWTTRTVFPVFLVTPRTNIRYQRMPRFLKIQELGTWKIFQMASSPSMVFTELFIYAIYLFPPTPHNLKGITWPMLLLQ